jgi:hypothetical protein
MAPKSSQVIRRAGQAKAKAAEAWSFSVDASEADDSPKKRATLDHPLEKDESRLPSPYYVGRLFDVFGETIFRGREQTLRQ